MDAVKERIADAIGPEATALSDDLGDAAIKQLLTLARELLEAGTDVIVEGFFQSNRYSPDFAELTTMADAVLLHFLADDAVLKNRYENRALAGERHWIHGDTEKLGSLSPELPPYMAERLQLTIPQIVIDTTNHSVDIDSTVQLIRQSRGLPLLERSA